MKKIFLKASMIFLLGVMVFGISANATQNTNPTVVINGEVVEFDVLPIIEDGRTLVPIRAISEKLNYDVLWDGENNRVEIKNGDEKLELFIDNQGYLKNGEQKQMDVPAKVTDGRTLVPLRLVAEEFGCVVRWIDELYTAEIVKHETVVVNTAEEFLTSLGSYKRIILAEGEYNLSDVDSNFSNPHIAKEEIYDGTEYIIYETTDLIIEGEEGKQVTIVVEPRYANVLPFMFSSHITIKNITAGHTIEAGSCTGGVIKLEDTTDVTIEHVKLYGCGTYGIIASYADTVNVVNSEIYDCTYGILDIYQSNNMYFDACVFRDSKGFDMFSVYESSDIGIFNSVIKNNESGEHTSIVGVYDSERVYFKNSEFIDNSYYTFATENVYFENCKGIDK